MPDNHGMAEWGKTLIGFISGISVGLIVGVISEPLKKWAGAKYITWRAEKEIYWELSGMYVRFFEEHKKIGNTTYVYVGPEFTAERFDYYYAEHKEALFSIPTWVGIKKIYDVFHLTKEQVDQHQISDAEGADRLKREFLICLDLKLLDKTKLFK
ncbi:MAG: hypothetical protein LAO76_04480 [Acidobacteriia bacterium]|nr:hypothetical protein [Terriglobia bacterium]